MTNREHHQHHREAAPGESAMAELLDLDAEVLHTYGSDVTAWLAERAGGRPPRRLLDLGSGTGTGTFALLKRFEEADATALDTSDRMLRHLRNNARELGLSKRIHTVRADLNAPWPALGTFDLAWAASSLHHMSDPGHILAEAFRTLRPGGILAVTEMDFFPRFLPDDIGLGRPGLEARVHAVLNRGHGDDLTSSLLRSGFILEAKRPFDIDLRRPLPTATGRYARACLRRLRAYVGTLVDSEDLATLDTLIDSDGPESLLRREDLTVRTTRTVRAAERP